MNPPLTTYRLLGGSDHEYDIVNPGSISRELGTQDGLNALRDRLRERRMHWYQDTVLPLPDDAPREPRIIITGMSAPWPDSAPARDVFRSFPGAPWISEVKP
jgi:hypothetical protein